jgi:hypothetical protein
VIKPCQDIWIKKLAIILIPLGVVVVFAISSFQARNLFAPGITEGANVLIKSADGTCVVEDSDEITPEYAGEPKKLNPSDSKLEKHKLS